MQNPPTLDIPGDIDIVMSQKNDSKLSSLRLQLDENTANDHIKKHLVVFDDVLYYITVMY